MSKTALILQPFGIGDAIFAQGVAHHFMEDGYRIVWPVKEEFVEGLSRAYPRLSWVDENAFNPALFNLKKDCLCYGFRVIPIRWSNSILGKPNKIWMRTKYDMYGLRWEDWKLSAYFTRTENEDKLFYEVLGLEDGDLYNLISPTYRSDFTGHGAIEVNNGLRNITMEKLPGFSLFDWALVIERAQTIHAVNSSILYLLEILNLDAQEVHLYSRKEEKGFPHVDYLFTKNYILRYT